MAASPARVTRIFATRHLAAFVRHELAAIPDPWVDRAGWPTRCRLPPAPGSWSPGDPPAAQTRASLRPRRSRSEFVTTVTELKAIAALANTGESSRPKAGYSTPAATGMPITL